MLKPMAKLPGPLHKNVSDDQRLKEIVKEGRNTKVISCVKFKRNGNGVDGWTSEALQRLGEVEGSLWQIRAELLGGKEKFELMLKRVDG